LFETGHGMVAAAILAGGRATRLGGRDKAALPFGDVRLIDRQLTALAGLADHLMVVVGAAAARAGGAADTAVPDTAGRLRDLGVPIVTDEVAAGAMGGLYTAIRATPAARTLVVACDLPFLRRPFLRHIIEAADAACDAAVPRSADGWQPLCACYARAAATVFERRIARRAWKLADALADLRVREIGPAEIARFDPDGLLLFNVNTPHDYARALDRLATSGGRERS
jgi:molybdopterin-guanine dinucleotide biosynthesis protein A